MRAERWVKFTGCESDKQWYGVAVQDGMDVGDGATHLLAMRLLGAGGRRAMCTFFCKHRRLFIERVPEDVAERLRTAFDDYRQSMIFGTGF